MNHHLAEFGRGGGQVGYSLDGFEPGPDRSVSNVRAELEPKQSGLIMETDTRYAAQLRSWASRYMHKQSARLFPK